MTAVHVSADVPNWALVTTTDKALQDAQLDGIEKGL